jgi:tetratricopeptide (TPR) repeat protein
MKLRSRQKRPPWVFLSSVVRGLEGSRAKIRQLIEDRGWTCLDSTVHPRFGGAPSACLNLVDQADLYLALFCEGTGTVDPITGLPITELEFYRAFYGEKPMRLYLLDSERREPRLGWFLDFWGGTFYGAVWFIRCRNEGDLYKKVFNDLRYFEDLYYKNQTDLWVVRSLPHPDDLPIVRPLPGPNQPASPRLRSTTFDDAIAEVTNSYRTHTHENVVAQVARTFKNLWPPQTVAETDGWLDLLRMWCHAALWGGLYKLAVWSALLSREIMVRNQRFRWFPTVSSNIALAHYVLAERVEAGAVRSSDEGGGRTQSARLYKVALTADELARELHDGSTPYLHRAYELSALGEHDRAIKDFREIEQIEKGRGVWHANALASLGRAYARSGEVRKAGQHLEQASSEVGRYLGKTPLAISTGATIAEGWIRLGELNAGCELCKKLVDLASRTGLADQEFKIRSLLRRANA